MLNCQRSIFNWEVASITGHLTIGHCTFHARQLIAFGRRIFWNAKAAKDRKGRKVWCRLQHGTFHVRQLIAFWHTIILERKGRKGPRRSQSLVQVATGTFHVRQLIAFWRRIFWNAKAAEDREGRKVRCRLQATVRS